MLKGLATSALLRVVRKTTGISTVGPIPGALLTSGASLVLTRGKRPIGLAVVALGAFLVWRDVEKEKEATRPALPPSSGAAAATGSH